MQACRQTDPWSNIPDSNRLLRFGRPTCQPVTPMLRMWWAFPPTRWHGFSSTHAPKSVATIWQRWMDLNQRMRESKSRALTAWLHPYVRGHFLQHPVAKASTNRFTYTPLNNRNSGRRVVGRVGVEPTSVGF